MKIIKMKNYEEVARKAADIVSSEIILNPKLVVGLATGSTPLGLYNELKKDYNSGKLDFSNIISYNLDEYVGIDRNNSNSYYYYMKENLFKYVNIKEENTNIPDGMTEDFKEECRSYEEKIKRSGGIDLQILGIGRNGHIGFNEPSKEFQCETHVVSLEEKTIRDNARFFKSIEKVPKKAISMGIKTIMKAKKIVLLACGEEKAHAILKTITGKIDPSIPASILKVHPDVTIIIDECAGKLLKE